MKYMQVIFERVADDGVHQFRQFYAPVTEEGCVYTVCGPLKEETHMLSQVSIAMGVGDFEEANINDSITGLDIPDGWTLAAWSRLPDNYVPHSAEVRDEDEKRAIDHLKKLGLWRDE